MLVKKVLNILDFQIRRKLKFSRKGLIIKNEDKNPLFFDEDLCKKIQSIISEYNLSQLEHKSTRHNYLENLYIIDILQNILDIKTKKNKAKILDIGSKNWFYANGEYAYFSKWFDNIDLTGIEIDGYRVYSNFYSRKDYADYYIKDLPNTSYIVGDLMNLKGNFDYITWFLPFVAEKPLLNWGLPMNCFKPKELTQKAYSNLNEGGKMLIVNQGLNEFEIQKNILNSLSIQYVEYGLIESEFLQYKNERYALVIEKPILPSDQQ